jgi:hypothetical protein
MLDFTDSVEGNNQKEQRTEPEQSVPQKPSVMDRLSIEQFGEEIAAKAHEERDPGLALVQQDGRQKPGGIRKGNWRSVLTMREVEIEDQKCRECSEMIQANVVCAARCPHAGLNRRPGGSFPKIFAMF